MSTALPPTVLGEQVNLTGRHLHYDVAGSVLDVLASSSANVLQFECESFG
ncbi:MAG: hypothetical protein ABSC31_05935 [Acidimicrobiales bacterium]